MSGRGQIKDLQAPESRERPADMLMRAVVDSIVAGRYEAEQALPPETALAEHFGVSRTIVRESMKRLEEKGLVAVKQGRGTLVQPHSSWNVLDPVVLSAVISHDERLHTLDELTMVRGSLEGVMAAQAAERVTEEGRAELAAALDRMISTTGDYAQFSEADVAFHRTVMELSENFLASNIAYTLFSRARSFARFEGDQPSDAIDLTVDEHRAIYEAIAAGKVAEAQQAMTEHILEAWERRNPARRA